MEMPKRSGSGFAIRRQTYWVYETGRCGHPKKNGTSQELATLSSETPCFWNSFFLETDFAGLGQMIQFQWTPLIVPRSVSKEDLMIAMVMSILTRFIFAKLQ